MLVSIENLSLGFTGKDKQQRPILRNLNLAISASETIGIVGESGSGKSTVALAMMGFLKSGLEVFEGRVIFDGHDMFALSEKERNALRGGDIALIPQNAGQSLTPTIKIGAQIDEALVLHTTLDAKARQKKVIELLSRVRLPSPEDIAERYPHELSGGQQQRVAIAMALGSEAKILLLDEPTTGLDVTTQAHILEFLRELSHEMGIAMVYVSHDLGVIARVADRIAVMYAGELVETGTTRSLLKTPAHPYSRALLSSIPKLGEKVIPASLHGFPPPVGEARKGCAFAPRCALTEAQCLTDIPVMVDVPHGLAKCHFADKVIHQAKPDTTPVVSNRNDEIAIAVEDLAISYYQPDMLDKLLASITGETAPPNTVERVTFSLSKGETLGLVGESGSGKSTIMRAIAGLKSPNKGTVSVKGKPIHASAKSRSVDELKPLQMIFQNADSALNPRRSIREILQAPLKLYFKLSPTELEARVRELIDAVRLPQAYLDRFPAQLSGGEKQRIGIARAFAAEPELVLCDEVTSALDVSVQAAALALLQQLQQKNGAAYIFVSHDLAVVRAISDQIAVLYQGRICEIGPAEAVFHAPFHPYTEVLLGAILEPDPDTAPKLFTDDIVEKSPPAHGCSFQRRCPKKLGDICENTVPPAKTLVGEYGEGHVIHCHLDAEALMMANEGHTDDHQVNIA